MTGVTPSYVILPSDVANTGKLADNVALVNENGANVQRQVVSVGDPGVAANRQTVNASGGASVSTIPLPASQLTPFVINTSASGLLQIGPAGAAGKTVKLYRLVLFVAGPTNITFEDATNPLSGPIPMNAGGNMIFDFSGDPWYSSAAGDALNINSSNAVQLSGTAYYVQS